MQQNDSGLNRREFLQLAIATGLYVTVEQFAGASETGGVPYRILGKTGEKVSIVGIGGYHLGVPDEPEAIRLVHAALDNGINFLDNCWDYNNGESEVRMGKALASGGYRKKAFLMTKFDSHSRDGATKQIDQSLQRLKTDHVDLLQFHEVIRADDPDKIFAPGGSAEAMLAAKKAGKTRYIGFTGHKSPDIHVKMMEYVRKHNFPLDTVQLPLNVMDAHFQSFTHKVLPLAVEMKLGILGMKPLGDKIILKSNVVKPEECLRFAMSLPTSVVITGCQSGRDIQQALRIARTFKPFTEKERTDLLARTAEVAKKGDFELYKTTESFDGTKQNPQWLG